MYSNEFLLSPPTFEMVRDIMQDTSSWSSSPARMRCTSAAAAAAPTPTWADHHHRGADLNAPDGSLAIELRLDDALSRERVLCERVLRARRWDRAIGVRRTSGWLLIALMWSPFGLALLLLRVCLVALAVGLSGLLVTIETPRRRKLMGDVCRGLLLPSLGIRVHLSGADRQRLDDVLASSSFHVIVSNHAFYADPLAVSAMLPTLSYALLCGTLLGGRSQWEWLMRLGLIGAAVYTSSAASAGEKQQTRAHLASLQAEGRQPLVAFPEGQVHGHSPLLRYERGVFTLGAPVVPLAMRLELPLGAPLELWKRTGSAGGSLALLLWLPFVRWRVRVLPVMHMTLDEATARERFAARVQCATAEALSVEATEYSMADASTVIPEVANALRRLDGDSKDRAPPPVLSAVPRVSSRADFEACIEAQRPAIFSFGEARGARWAEQITGQSGLGSLPLPALILQGSRPSSAPPAYVTFWQYTKVQI